MSGELLHHDLAPCTCQIVLWPHAQNLCPIAICDNQSRIFGQQLGREIDINGPEKPVAPFQIALPLLIGLEINLGRFALDYPNLTLRAQRHHIDP